MKKLPFAALIISALLLSACTVRSVPAPSPASSVPTVAEERVAEGNCYTLTFILQEGEITVQELAEGSYPTNIPLPVATAPFLGWQNEQGELVDPAAVPVIKDACYTALYGVSLRRDVFYLRAEGGLFRPHDPLSRLECAQLYCKLLPEGESLPTGEVPEEQYPDQALCNTKMNANTLIYEEQNYLFAKENPRQDELLSLASLCAVGLLPYGENQSLSPEEPITSEQLLSLLSPWFSPHALADPALSSLPTRGETVLFLNALLGREAEISWRCPDTDDTLMSAVCAACPMEQAEAGFVLLGNGSLYYVQDDGTLLQNGEIGTLHFGVDGRYSSGNEELDRLCRKLIAQGVNLNNPQELRLRQAYIFIRDHYAYLRGGNYERGEHGWEDKEAVKLLSTGYGNCYSFSAALRSVFRALGQEAECISGLQGEFYAPHSWVWTREADGIYFYDVEAEYAALRDGFSLNPMYRMGYLGIATQWLYVYDAAAEGIHLS